MATQEYLKEAYELAKSDKAVTFALDTETDGVDPRFAVMCGFSFSDGHRAFYIPTNHFEGNAPEQVWKQILTAVLEHPLVGHNISYDQQVLRRAGFNPVFVDDSMLIAYSIGIYEFIGLKHLSKEVLQHEMIEIKDLFGNQKVNMPSLPPDAVAKYAEDDALQTLRLYNKLKPQLTDRTSAIYRMELKLIPVMEKLEASGIPVDIEWMKSEGKRLQDAADLAKRSFYDQICKEFGCTEFEAKVRYPYNSTKALKILLYEPKPNGLGLKPLRQTDAGNNSTDASALSAYVDIPIVSNLFCIREMEARSSRFYLKLAEMAEADGRIHARWNQTGATSGRMTSSNPNVQNWSSAGSWTIKTLDGPVYVEENFRNCLKPRAGEWLLEMDYSQIEYRLIAGYIKSKRLIELMRSGEDMHKATYAFCFQVPVQSVTKAQRRIGKTINFALAYGMGVQHFYRELGGEFTMEQTADIHRRYFEMLPELVAFHDSTRRMTDRTHSVDTYFGRHQTIPEYNSTNKFVLSKAQRAGVNRIIQGTAADILKIALIKVNDMIEKKYSGKVELIMSVHDSMVFIGSDEVDMHDFITDVRECAEIQLPDFPRITINAKSGPAWGSMKDVESEFLVDDGPFSVDLMIPTSVTAGQLSALNAVLGENLTTGNSVNILFQGQSKLRYTVATKFDIESWATSVGAEIKEPK